MLEVIRFTITPMLMMFLCIVIGYLLNKARLLPENADVTLSKLVTLVLLPALNISTFMNYCTVESLYAYRYYVVVSGAVCVVAIGLAYLLSMMFSKKGYQRNIYRYALTFGNASYLGNAIVPLILGDEYLFPYLLFCLPTVAFCYTWGVSNLIPKNQAKTNVFKNLLNPTVVAMAIGAVIGLSGLGKIIPSFLSMSLSNLSSCMGPVAMVLTGFVVAKYKLGGLLKNLRVYLASLFRLVIIPSIFIATLLFLKVDKQIVIMCLFAFATPLGLNVVIYPSAYGGDTSTGASMALVSHALAVISIPVMYTVLTGVFF